MSDIFFMGYKVHRDIQHFTPNTVLFSNAINNIRQIVPKPIRALLPILTEKILKKIL